MGLGRRLLVLQGESHSDLLLWLHRPEPLPASSTLDEALASEDMERGELEMATTGRRAYTWYAGFREKPAASSWALVELSGRSLIPTPAASFGSQDVSNGHKNFFFIFGELNKALAQEPK